MLVADASPRLRAQAERPRDTQLIVKGAPEAAEFETRMGQLISLRDDSSAFEAHEMELIDAYEGGLTLARVEVETLLSRALYDVFVAGKQASPEVSDLIARYRAYTRANALDIHSRRMLLNQDNPLALGRTGPDGTASWARYSDPEIYNQMSGAAQRALQRRYGRIGRVRGIDADRVGDAAEPSSPEVAPTDVLVNNPAADATTLDTQSETSLVLCPGDVILSSWNDSGSNVNANRFTGTGRSTDRGDTWTDQGGIASPTANDAGDPVFARRNRDGRVILTTLETDLVTIQVFRSDDNGMTYLPAVRSAVVRRGDQHDKEWVAADNFAGAGNGNFYLAWRNFSIASARSGITFLRSTDGGTTWGAEQVLKTGQQGAWPVVGADHSVYVFWYDSSDSGKHSIRMRKSTNQGASFGGEVTCATLNETSINGDLDLDGGFRTNSFPQVVAHPFDPNRLYMVYNDLGSLDPRDANIFFTQSADGGATWSTPVAVNDDAALGDADQFQPVIAIAPSGAMLFISWYDRRLNAPLIDVFATIGAISADTVTFSPDFRLNSQAFPVVIGQDPSVNLAYMGDYDQAVADDTFFYRTWADNRGSSATHVFQPDVRFSKTSVAGPGPILTGRSATIVSGNCGSPANAGIDPGETVTVQFTVENNGTSPVANLIGSLQAGGGITNPGPVQSFGSLAPGAAVSANFTFTASPALACGAAFTATMAFSDGAAFLGNATFHLTVGSPGPTVTTTYSSGDINVAIPQVGAATPIVIDVPDSGFIADVNVRLRANHTSDGELDIVLEHPDGTRIDLINNRGGSGDNVGSGGANCSGAPTILDDAAATPISEALAPFAGAFRPERPLALLNGKPARGAWVIWVTDETPSNSGTIFCAQLEISRQVPICSPCGGGGNVPPVANAGPDQNVNSCTIVTLNGSGSSDPDSSPNPLTYSWSQTAGPTVVINNPTAVIPTFEAPNVAASSVLTFQLTVNDGAAMVSDTVDVIVNHVVGVHVDTGGLYLPSTFFLLRNCNGPGPADAAFAFGGINWIPVPGDFDGDGDDTAGAFDPVNAVFYLRNSNTSGVADVTVAFGAAGDIPLVGDWDGDGDDTIGLYRPSPSQFFLKNTNTPGAADVTVNFGSQASNFLPIVGDWDGNGTTTVGLYQTSSAGWFLRNSNTSGAADITFVYGPPAGSDWVPVVGDWDGLGGDSCGLFQRSTSSFFLKNTNASGSADILYQFGTPVNTFTPISNNWDGL